MKKGTYLFNFTLSNNGTTKVPNIHVIVTDANGTREYDYVNVMNNSTTSGSIFLNTTANANVKFQVQGQDAKISLPGMSPQGELSVVRLSTPS